MRAFMIRALQLPYTSRILPSQRLGPTLALEGRMNWSSGPRGSAFRMANAGWIAIVVTAVGDGSACLNLMNPPSWGVRSTDCPTVSVYLSLSTSETTKSQFLLARSYSPPLARSLHLSATLLLQGKAQAQARLRPQGPHPKCTAPMYFCRLIFAQRRCVNTNTFK